jgi:DNA-binding NtrC family response regulator
MMFRDARKGQFERRNTIAQLLGDWVVLLAMKHQRAPLPVSSALWKGLLRRGFPNNLDELAMFARRYLFLGDERLLLAELRIRTATTPPVREALSKEREIAAEERPHIEDAHKCQ